MDTPSEEVALELTEYLNSNGCFAYNIMEEDGFSEEPIDVRAVQVEVDGELTTILDSWSSLNRLDELFKFAKEHEKD